MGLKVEVPKEVSKLDPFLVVVNVGFSSYLLHLSKVQLLRKRVTFGLLFGFILAPVRARKES